MKIIKTSGPMLLTVVVFMIVLCATTLSGEFNVPGANDWPGWRGPNRDGISAETDWQTKWPEGSLKVLWEASVGVGYSSVSVVGKRFIPWAISMILTLSGVWMLTPAKKCGDTNMQVKRAATRDRAWAKLPAKRSISPS